MKKRLFLFGCSFTVYGWPTWATLLSTSNEFDEVQNWGFAGLGNRAIAERVAEANIKNNFTENDTVIVQWSTHLRNDFFHQEGLLSEVVPGWKTRGSLFNFENSLIYDSVWLQTFFDEEAYIYHTLNFIHITQQLLENVGCKWYMTSIGDIRNLCKDFQVNPKYGEKSIFSKLEEIFNKKEFPLYIKTPSLKVYDDKIWTKHQDKWLDPILTFLQKEIKDTESLFFSFYNEEYQESFFDFHPKTNKFYFWLDKILIEKTKIKPDETVCAEICDQVEALYVKMQGRKVPFELALTKQIFGKSTWPEKVLGFQTF